MKLLDAVRTEQEQTLLWFWAGIQAVLPQEPCDREEGQQWEKTQVLGVILTVDPWEDARRVGGKGFCSNVAHLNQALTRL